MGQVFDVAGNARDDVYFHSVGTFPTLHAMGGNRLAIVVPKDAPPTHENDSIKRVDLAFTGPNAKRSIPFLWEPTPKRYHFYEQFTPQGILDVTGGKRVIYEDMYDYIDMHLYSNKWGPKMYIVIRPGGDPNDIQISWYGHTDIGIDVDGYLRVWFGQEFLKLTQGLAYQQIGNDIVEVPWTAGYVISNDSLSTRFSFGTYNTGLPLILMVRPFNPSQLPMGGGDPPPPEWCTFFAGTGHDVMSDMAHDAEGYVYFTGHSRSGADQLPVSTGQIQQDLGGASDIIYGRFNEFYEIETPDTWMGYIGGANVEEGYSCAYDPVNERLVIGGYTRSCQLTSLPNFALVSNPSCYQRPYCTYQDDGLLLFADPATGERTYLTRTPMFRPQTSTLPVDVAVDADGNTYMVGTMEFTIPWYDDAAASLQLDPGAYVELYNSQDTQTELFYYDAAILQLDAQANRTWFTPLGGFRSDHATACAVDNANKRLVVVGNTHSTNDDGTDDCTAPASATDPALDDFPICGTTGYVQRTLNGTNSANTTDGFIAVFDLNDRTKQLATYFGGIAEEKISDVAVNSFGAVYLSGFSNTGAYSANPCVGSPPVVGFPTCESGGFYNVAATRRGFIAQLKPDNTLNWSTKLGDYYGTSSPEKLWLDEQDHTFLLGSTTTAVAYLDPVPLTPLANTYYQSDHKDAPTTTNTDSYVAEFNAYNELVGATLFGGIGSDLPKSIMTVGERIYVCGATYSLIFPTHEPYIEGHDPYLNETPQAVLNQRADGYIAQLVNDFTNGVQEIASTTSGPLHLYPNPADDRVWCDVEESVNNGRLMIHDGTGRLISEQAILTGGKLFLDLIGLAKGAYTVSLWDGNQRIGACSLVRY